MEFSDTKEFYEELRNNLKKSVDVEIRTTFTNQDQLTKNLITVMGGKPFVSTIATLSAPTGFFLPGTSSIYRINWVVIFATAGAVIGSAFGPIGFASGPIVGAVVGFIASIANGKNDREINLEVSVDGKLKINMKSKRKKVNI